MAGFAHGLPLSRIHARAFGGDLEVLSMQVSAEKKGEKNRHRKKKKTQGVVDARRGGACWLQECAQRAGTAMAFGRWEWDGRVHPHLEARGQASAGAVIRTTRGVGAREREQPIGDRSERKRTRKRWRERESLSRWV
eukprot:2202061-Rhodomonas_salina.2